MNTYLISYDLDKPGQNYTDLINRLQKLGAVKILYSEWISRTTATAVAIRDDLQRFVDANDGLLVAGLTGEAAWRGSGLKVAGDTIKRLLAA